MSESLTKAYFFELIIYLIRCQRYTHNINQRTNLSNITIGEIVNFIENNYGRQLTLPETAAQFGIKMCIRDRPYLYDICVCLPFPELH